MFDLKTQTELVDATAAMVRSCFTATTNTWAASAWRGLSLWAELMGTANQRGAAAAPPTQMLWPSMANWMASPQLYAWPPWSWTLPGNAAGVAFAPFARAWPGPSFSSSFSFWAPLSDWGAWGRTPLPAWNGWFDPRPTAAMAPPLARPVPAAKPAAAEAPYASYRSSGGHAVAQVIVPAIMSEAEIAEIAEVSVTAVLTPVQTMLGVWRAAFGG